MNEDDRFAAIKLIEHVGKCRIAEEFSVVAGEHADAVELEDTQRIFHLMQTAVGVRQRNSSEHSKSARIVSHQLRAKLVAFSRPGACSFVVVKPNAGRR